MPEMKVMRVEEVRAATDGRGADIILEMVGGDFVQQNLRCLNAFGRMVVYGSASGERGTLVPAELMRKNQVVAGFFLPQITGRPDLLGDSLREILGWISSGDLKLNIGALYPLEEAAEAHRALEGRETTAKIVLNPR